ncbi:unnamed protein product [Phaedon cochleariae]|uniref:glutathione transferase n=1 Tax=Phaedon cochleariae TaxID=80249 RepID=A0A9P0DHV0_PHACE|nr:unnamed protein product [Phaedon cochleariae]
MAPAYKLTYFNVTSLGEPIRFLLNYGNLEFEDVRIDMEQWPTIKPTMPFGQMPILEHNGKVAHQSIPIARYVAKQVKLNGKNDWEDLEIDSAVETVNDLRAKLAVYHHEKDEAVKEAKAGPLFNEILPYYLEKLEAQVKLNNGYLACGRLTWADMYFVGILNYLNFMALKDIIADSPSLVSVKEHVLALPSIKAWIEKRPKTHI